MLTWRPLSPAAPRRSTAAARFLPDDHWFLDDREQCAVLLASVQAVARSKKMDALAPRRAARLNNIVVEMENMYLRALSHEKSRTALYEDMALDREAFVRGYNADPRMDDQEWDDLASWRAERETKAVAYSHDSRPECDRLRLLYDLKSNDVEDMERVRAQSNRRSCFRLMGQRMALLELVPDETVPAVVYDIFCETMPRVQPRLFSEDDARY